VFTDVLHS